MNILIKGKSDLELRLGQVTFEVLAGSWLPKSGAQGKGYLRNVNLRFTHHIDD